MSALQYKGKYKRGEANPAVSGIRVVWWRECFKLKLSETEGIC